VQATSSKPADESRNTAMSAIILAPVTTSPQLVMRSADCSHARLLQRLSHTSLAQSQMMHELNSLQHNSHTLRLLARHSAVPDTSILPRRTAHIGNSGLRPAALAAGAHTRQASCLGKQTPCGLVVIHRCQRMAWQHTAQAMPLHEVQIKLRQPESGSPGLVLAAGACKRLVVCQVCQQAFGEPA
jgi:hypothetical protein